MKYICENCGNEHDGSYGSGRFCSRICATSYSSKFANTDEKKKQKSITIKSKVKEVECECCHNTFNVQISSNRVLCDDCFANRIKTRKTRLSNKDKCIIRRNRKLYRCRFCGAEYKKCKHPEICSHYQLVERMSKYLGFNKGLLGTEKVYEEYNRIKNDVHDLYWIKNMSIEEIRILCNYPYSTGNFSKLLSHFIKFRSVKDSLLNAFKRNRVKIPVNKTYVSGFHISWNGKKFFYRSSYELDYCKELDHNKINYDMETLKIEYYDTQLKKNRIAIPDFLLIDENRIVEVKSSITYDKQNMIDKVKAYKENGYSFSLLYEHKMYNDMEFLKIDDYIFNTYRQEHFT